MGVGKRALIAGNWKMNGLGASAAQLDKIIAYIKSQEEHHRKISFQDEFRMLLEKHRIEYDERYLWR